jgi:hypothetical protein
MLEMVIIYCSEIICSSLAVGRVSARRNASIYGYILESYSELVNRHSVRNRWTASTFFFGTLLWILCSSMQPCDKETGTGWV